MNETIQYKEDLEEKSFENVEDLLRAGDFSELTRLVQQKTWTIDERKQLLILIVTVVSPSIDPKNYYETISVLFQEPVTESDEEATPRENEASLIVSDSQKRDGFALNIIKLALLMEACGQVYYSLKFVDYCLSSIPETYFVSEAVSQVTLATRSEINSISGVEEEERAMVHFIATQELFVHLSVFCRLFSKELIDVSTSLFDWTLLSKRQKISYHLKQLFSQGKSQDHLMRLLGELLQKEFFEMFDSELPLNSFLSKNLFLQVLREAERGNFCQDLTEETEYQASDVEEDTEEVILQVFSEECPSLNRDQIFAILLMIEERFAKVSDNEREEEEEEASSLSYSEEFYVKLLLLIMTRLDLIDPFLSLLRSILSLIFSQVTRPISEKLLLCLYELERISVVATALSGLSAAPPLKVLAPQWVQEATQQIDLQSPQDHFNVRRCLMMQANLKEELFLRAKDLFDVVSHCLKLHRILDQTSVFPTELLQTLLQDEEEQDAPPVSCYDYSLEEILIFAMGQATVKSRELGKAKDVHVESTSTESEHLAVAYLRNVDELFSANERTVRVELVQYLVCEVLRRILSDAQWKEIISLGLFGLTTGSNSSSASDSKIFEWIEKLFPDMSKTHFAVFCVSKFLCDKELLPPASMSSEQSIYYLNLLRIANFDCSDSITTTGNLKAYLQIEFNASSLRNSALEEVCPVLYDRLFSDSNLIKQEIELSPCRSTWLKSSFDAFLKTLEEVCCDAANISQAKSLFQLIVGISYPNEEDCFDAASQYTFSGYAFLKSLLSVYRRYLLHFSLLSSHHSLSRATPLLDEMIDHLAGFSGRFVLVLFRISMHLREFRECFDFCDYFFQHSALFTDSSVKVKSEMIEEIFRFRDLISSNYHYSGDSLVLTQKCMCFLSDDEMMKSFDKLLSRTPRHLPGCDSEDIGNHALGIIHDLIEKLVTSAQDSSINSILDQGFRNNLEEEEVQLTFMTLINLAANLKETSQFCTVESLSTQIKQALASQITRLKEELVAVRSVLNASSHFQNELEINQVNETYVNKLVKSGFSVSGAKKAVYETRKVGTFEAALQFAITHNQDEGFDNPIVLGEKRSEGLILSSSRSRALEALQRQDRLNRMLSTIRRISERLFPSDSKSFMEMPVISIAENSRPFVKEESQEVKRSDRLKQSSQIDEDVEEEPTDLKFAASIPFESAVREEEEDKTPTDHPIAVIPQSLPSELTKDEIKEHVSNIEELSSRQSETEAPDSPTPTTSNVIKLPMPVEEVPKNQNIRDVLSPKLRGLHQKLALSVELQAFLDHFYVLGEDGRTVFAVENFHILVNKVIHSTTDEAFFFDLMDDTLPFIIKFIKSDQNSIDLDQRLAELLFTAKEIEDFRDLLLDSSLSSLSQHFLDGLEAKQALKSGQGSLLESESYCTQDRIISLCFLSRWLFFVRNEEASLLHHFTSDFQLHFFQRFPLFYIELLCLFYETINKTDWMMILWVKERLADLVDLPIVREVFLDSVFPHLLQLLHPSIIASSVVESTSSFEAWQTLLQEECQILKRVEKIHGTAQEFGAVFNAKAFIQSEILLPSRYFPLQSNNSKQFLWRKKFVGLSEIFACLPSEEDVLLSLIPLIYRYFGKYLSLQGVSDLFFLAILRQLNVRISDGEEDKTFHLFDDSLLEKLSPTHVRILCYLIAGWPLEKLLVYDQTIEQVTVVTSPSFDGDPSLPLSQILFLPNFAQISQRFHASVSYATKHRLLLRIEQNSIRQSSQQIKSKIKKLGAAAPASDVNGASASEGFINQLLIPFCQIFEDVESLSESKDDLLEFFTTSFDEIPSSEEKLAGLFLWPHCNSTDLQALEQQFLASLTAESGEGFVLDDVRFAEVLGRFYRWFFDFQFDTCRSSGKQDAKRSLNELFLDLSRKSFDDLLRSFDGCDDTEGRQHCGKQFARFMIVVMRGKSLIDASANPKTSSFEELIVEYLETVWKETVFKCRLTSDSVQGTLIQGDGLRRKSKSEFVYLLNRRLLSFAMDVVGEHPTMRAIGPALDDFHYLIQLLQLADVRIFEQLLSLNHDRFQESPQWRVEWHDDTEILSTETFILKLVATGTNSLNGHSEEFYRWLLIYLRKLLISPSSLPPSLPINIEVQRYVSTALSSQLVKFFHGVEVSSHLTFLRSNSGEIAKSSWLSFLQVLLHNGQWSVLSEALLLDFPVLFKLHSESSSNTIYQHSQDFLNDLLKADNVMTSSSSLPSTKNFDSSREIAQLLAHWFSSPTVAGEELVGRLKNIALRMEGSRDIGKLQVICYNLFPSYAHTLIPSLWDLSEPKEGRNVFFRLLLCQSFPAIETVYFDPLQRDDETETSSIGKHEDSAKLWPEPLDLVCVILLQGYALEAFYLNWFLQRLPRVSFSVSQGALLLRQEVARKNQLIECLDDASTPSSTEKLLSSERCQLFRRALDCLRQFS